MLNDGRVEKELDVAECDALCEREEAWDLTRQRAFHKLDMEARDALLAEEMRREEEREAEEEMRRAEGWEDAETAEPGGAYGWNY
jgi:hypothetical protein